MNSNFAHRRRGVNRGRPGNGTTTTRIIFPAPGFIVQHLIRLVQCLHFIFRTAAVRVALVGQPLVKAFEIPRRRPFARAENFVIVLVLVESIQSGFGIVELRLPIFN